MLRRGASELRVVEAVRRLADRVLELADEGAAAGVDADRVEEVVEQVVLDDVGERLGAGGATRENCAERGGGGGGGGGAI